jgi:hypothetical protein
MLHEKQLPSGQKLVSLSSGMEATAGAMKIEGHGICPKCNKSMGFATSGGEQVFYCAPDRVCLPIPISN